LRQRGIRMPDSVNPGAQLERYKVPARGIRHLTRKQIAEQLDVLSDSLLLQVMVATLIYAGLRRAEVVWLTVGL